MTKCKTCIYRTIFSGYCGCGYILITGKCRDSPVDNCDKYRRGKSIAEQRLSAAFSYKNKRKDNEK